MRSGEVVDSGGLLPSHQPLVRSIRFCSSPGQASRPAVAETRVVDVWRRREEVCATAQRPAPVAQPFESRPPPGLTARVVCRTPRFVPVQRSMIFKADRQRRSGLIPRRETPVAQQAGQGDHPMAPRPRLHHSLVRCPGGMPAGLITRKARNSGPSLCCACSRRGADEVPEWSVCRVQRY